MPTTNSHSGTRIDEIADRIYRISTPVPPGPSLPAGFTFNQFLIVDDDPLLFHTGMRKMFAFVHEAVATVMAVDRLRWVAFSHAEADESGAAAEWLNAAPRAALIGGQIGAMINLHDLSDRPHRVLADGETIALGQRQVQWLDAPHVPHGWDSGFIAETTTRTLFCGDLLTQPGDRPDPITERDVLGPSEQMRAAGEYYSNPAAAAATVERLAATEPALLACMHGSAFRGRGDRVLRELATALRGAR